MLPLIFVGNLSLIDFFTLILKWFFINKSDTPAASNTGILHYYLHPKVTWLSFYNNVFVSLTYQVVKKRSGCKHKAKVECHQNLDATLCREKCARSLPCKHFCKKPCYVPCGDCEQKVLLLLDDL